MKVEFRDYLPGDIRLIDSDEIDERIRDVGDLDFADQCLAAETMTRAENGGRRPIGVGTVQRAVPGDIVAVLFDRTVTAAELRLALRRMKRTLDGIVLEGAPGPFIAHTRTPFGARLLAALDFERAGPATLDGLAFDQWRL